MPVRLLITLKLKNSVPKCELLLTIFSINSTECQCDRQSSIVIICARSKIKLRKMTSKLCVILLILTIAIVCVQCTCPHDSFRKKHVVERKEHSEKNAREKAKVANGSRVIKSDQHDVFFVKPGIVYSLQNGSCCMKESVAIRYHCSYVGVKNIGWDCKMNKDSANQPRKYAACHDPTTGHYSHYDNLP